MGVRAAAHSGRARYVHRARASFASNAKANGRQFNWRALCASSIGRHQFTGNGAIFVLFKRGEPSRLPLASGKQMSGGSN